MTPDAVPIRCAILRGGTSRAVFFRADDLPSDRPRREAILLSVLGSPDARQIDGLGGATSLTSKAAIVAPSRRPGADVDYTFAQVSVSAARVDWGGNCGNISAAVGAFAIDNGLVKVDGSRAEVRIYNTNTGKTIIADVPLSGTRAAATGDFRIPGVPTTGPRVRLEFRDPAGAVTGRLLPTGKPRDSVVVADGRLLTVSIVDAGNPVAFVAAAEVGLEGLELPAAIDSRPETVAILEELRGKVAQLLGIVADAEAATQISPGLPKIGVISGPQGYLQVSGTRVRASEVDLLGRMMSMQRAHQSYPITGAIATAAAAVTAGTLVHQAAGEPSASAGGRLIRIGHPVGVMEVTIRATSDIPPHIEAVTVDRTARYIMDGRVFVPATLMI